jgi:hypothetical protein
LEVELLTSAFSREGATEIGSRVRFSTRSIFLPNPEEAASFVSGCDELEGIIAGFSDSGASGFDHFTGMSRSAIPPSPTAFSTD